MENCPENKNINKKINKNINKNKVKRNYQKELDKVIEGLVKEEKVPRLLMHSCCAPCSSYCIEYLSKYFEITIFYYNPNIYPPKEYTHRVQEQKRLVSQMNVIHKVEVAEGTFEPKEFYEAVKGTEHIKEGGERCFKCYELRLRETAKEAKMGEFDYFTTTLSISPLKNAEKLNEIGENLADEYGIKYLNSDFKKKNGYKRSIELSKEYNLYRQNYCGCVFSMKEKEEADALH